MALAADILILMERISRALHNEGYSGGLKPTQWEALRYFARANRPSRTPSALTDYLGMTKGTVSQTINALERKGLIQKEAGIDRRVVYIALTPQGYEMLQNDPLDHFAAFVSNLATPQKEQLNDALKGFLGETLHARGGRPFGACKTCRYYQQNNGSATCGLLKVSLDASESGKICVEHEAIPSESAIRSQNGNPL
jgi:DNA-binding MarR family transcriptional regulator